MELTRDLQALVEALVGPLELTPTDVTKTVYHAMGIHDLEAKDSQNRPYNLLSEGRVIEELF